MTRNLTPQRRIRILAFAAVITGLSVLARAATFTVNTTDVIVCGNCSPLCSLPDEMLLAHDGDLIAFNVGDVRPERQHALQLARRPGRGSGDRRIETSIRLPCGLRHVLRVFP
jgi:hypothetical protein